MAKIAFFELEEWEKDYLRSKLGNHELVLEGRKLDEKTASKAAGAEVVCFFIYSQLSPKVLAKLGGKARLFCTMSTGFDHVPLQECRKAGITVCNVPAYGDNTVAEHTFALILAIARKLLPSAERARRGNFSLEGLRGFDLQGKTLGVVGTGKIGRHVIKIAKGFGMKVIAFDAKPDLEFAAAQGFSYAHSLEEVLVNSDILTLHVPLTPETKYLINESNVDFLRKGAVLINTSRGAVVQASALLKALKQGVLSAAGLDVLEEECFVREEKELLSEAFQKTCDLKTALENHILLEQENVIVTPHNAFNSQEALQRILDTTVENIEDFLQGKPKNAV